MKNISNSTLLKTNHFHLVALLLATIFVDSAKALPTTLLKSMPVSTALEDVIGKIIVPVVLKENISSEKKRKSENKAYFEIADDIYEGSNLILRKGTLVESEIVTKKRRSVGRPGKIEITFLWSTSEDGSHLEFNQSIQLSGRPTQAKVATAGILTGPPIALGSLGFTTGALAALALTGYAASKGTQTAPLLFINVFIGTPLCASLIGLAGIGIGSALSIAALPALTLLAIKGKKTELHDGQVFYLTTEKRHQTK